MIKIKHIVKDYFVIIMLLGGLFLRFILAGFLPLTPDEAYYWIWSQHIQAGYIDHPPMVALWIRIGTYLWGNTAFGVRFLAPLAVLGSSLALLGTGSFIWSEKPYCGERALYLLNIAIFCGLGMVSMTPDTPLILFTSLSIWSLSRALHTSCYWRGLGWWVAVGIFLGLGGLSKYTEILPALGIVGFVLSSRERLWRHAGPWLGGSVACCFLIPVIQWNFVNHWSGFTKQGGRITAWNSGKAFHFLGELFAGQIGLLTPIVFICVSIGAWRLWRLRKNFVLLWLIFPGSIFFIAHACGDRVQANWPSVFYPALFLIGATAGRYWRSAVWSGGGLCACIIVQSMWHPLPLETHWNPLERQMVGWNALADQLDKITKYQKIHYIIVNDYALASILVFYHTNHQMILGGDQRWSALKGVSYRKKVSALSLEDAHYTFLGDDIIVRRDKRGRPVRGYHLHLIENATGAILP